MSKEFTISNITFYRIAIWSGGVALIYFFRDLILMLILGIFFAVILEVPIQKLTDKKIKIGKYTIGFGRVSATFFIFAFVLSLLLFASYKAFPIIYTQIMELYKNLYGKLLSLKNYSTGLEFLDQSNILPYIRNELLSVLNMDSIAKGIKTATNSFSAIFSATGSIFGSILNFLLIMVFTFYFCLEEKGVERLIKTISPSEKVDTFINIWDRAQNKIQNWAEGQFLAAVIMATIVFVCLAIVKMPYYFVFTFLSFIGQMIPLVGLLLSSIPAIIIAFLLVDAKFAMIIAILFFIISQIENYIVYPKVMDNKVGVPALFVLISILIGMKLLGFWGVVLAVPVAAVIIELVRDMNKNK